MNASMRQTQLCKTKQENSMIRSMDQHYPLPQNYVQNKMGTNETTNITCRKQQTSGEGNANESKEFCVMLLSS